MLRKLGLALLLAVALAAAPGLESPAAALSCLAPLEPPPSPYRTHPIVIEGVALSGPSDPQHGLASPARMLVSRWLRGSGPRVVRVETAVRFDVGPYLSDMPGFFRAHAGAFTRLFVYDTKDGVLLPNPCVFGPDPRPLRSPLRPVPGSRIRAAAGDYDWRAHAERGPHGLHCVAVHPVGRHTGGQKECDLRRPLLSVQHEGESPDEIDSTAVTVAGPGIGEVALRTPDGPIVLRPRAPDHPVLAVLAGRVDAAEVRARVAMDDGTVQWLQPIGFPTSLAIDPELGPPWYSAFDPRGRRTCVGSGQLPPRHGPREGEYIAVDRMPLCRDLRRVPYFFAVRGARPSQPFGGDVVPERVRTVVLGAAGRSVSTITIRDPGGERRLTPGRGGQFLAVYPASTLPADLVIEFALRDGTSVVHRGRPSGP